MGSSEDEKSVKPEKASYPPPPPPPDQSNIHVYSDWAAMQAYYGHRVSVPPYFNSGVASGQAPHPYMWGPPQPMMPPYGVPYAALYAHGGVYAHPGVPLAAHALSMDAPPKSPGTMDNGLMKKLKGFDGLAMSIGNGNGDSNDGTEPVLSQSGETEGSSGGSNGNSKRACQNGRKRSREAKPHMIGEGKSDVQSNKISSGQENNCEKVIGASVGAVRIAGKEVGVVVSPSVTSSLELKHSPNANAKISPASVQPTSTGTPNDSWLHNEREMKRERRKQSNRESARRSRLRKQAEAEELAIKVDSLTAENVTLKSEINRLTENSENLKNENAKLMEFMKNAQSGQIEDATFLNCDEKKTPTLSTANLLSRVNNAGSVDVSEGEGEMYENSSKSGTKLHQLLDASPRTDAVAAG